MKNAESVSVIKKSSTRKNQLEKLEKLEKIKRKSSFSSSAHSRYRSRAVSISTGSNADSGAGLRASFRKIKKGM